MSNINGLVIEVGGASAQQGAPIQTGMQNLTDAQLWQFVPDPGGSGYSSIQSKLSTPSTPLVINVAGGSAQSGTPLILWPTPPTAPTPNELWEAVVTLPTTSSSSSAAAGCQSILPNLQELLGHGQCMYPNERAEFQNAIDACYSDGYFDTKQKDAAMTVLNAIPDCQLS